MISANRFKSVAGIPRNPSNSFTPFSDRSISSASPWLTGAGNSVDQLSKLADLKQQGVITDAEFEAQKAKLLS